MKLGIVSDVHAAPGALQQALKQLADAGADSILCTGDIAGYHEELDTTIGLLSAAGCDCILGNHDLTWLQQHSDQADSASFRFLSSLPYYRQYLIDNIRIYAVHAEPPDKLHGGIKLLDEQAQPIDSRLAEWRQKLQDFDHDVLIVGHTHQVYAQHIAGTLVINPGSTVFNHSCMILQLPEKHVQVLALPGQKVSPVWNWGMFVRQTQSSDHSPSR